MARVYMIRHGRAAAGWGDQGADPDPGLDAVGRTQADAACAALMGMAQPPTLVLTSPLRRSRETASPLAAALGLEALVEPRVAEIPTPKAVLAADRTEWLRNAFSGTWAGIDGDLDYLAWRDAVAAAVIAHPGAAIFSHFVAINAAVSAALGRPEVRVVQPDNGSITVFETDGTALVLVQDGLQAETRVL
jgi:broad specificity phosphatase PhoE